MSVQLINTADLPTSPAYVQVGVAQGTTLVYVSGQVARDGAGNPVGAGDLAAQLVQVYRNLAVALTAAGATFDDVVRLNAYVVDLGPAAIEQIMTGAGEVFGDLPGNPVRPMTMVGVSSLAEPDLLIEVEAVAVLG